MVGICKNRIISHRGVRPSGRVRLAFNLKRARGFIRRSASRQRRSLATSYSAGINNLGFRAPTPYRSGQSVPVVCGLAGPQWLNFTSSAALSLKWQSIPTGLLSEVAGRMSDVATAGPSIGVQIAQSIRRDDAPLSKRATLSHIRRDGGRDREDCRMACNVLHLAA